MTAREYLNTIKEKRERIKTLEEEIEQLRTDAESVSINLDGMPRNNGQSSFEKLAIQLAETESKLTQEMSDLWSEVMRAHSLIGQMSSSQRQQILTKRYLKGQRWEEIAYEMNFSWNHCFRVHGMALAELDKILEKEWKNG